MKTRPTLNHVAVLAALAVLWHSPFAAAQGNLVIEGDFNPNADAWTLVGAGTTWEGSKGDPEPDLILDSLTASPSPPPSASQTIDGLVDGDTYVVSGDFRNVTDRGGGSPTDNSFGVAINGVYLFEAAQESPNNWRSFDFLYTATASSADLSLAAEINGTGVVYEIDNISLEAVPESGSFCLFTIGAIAVSCFIVRKDRREPAVALEGTRKANCSV
jgi:hypothetical protein